MDNPFIGNINAFNEIQRWINTPSKNVKLFYNDICILFGSPGSGKTYGINKIIEESNKIPCILNLDIYNGKTFKNYFEKLTSSNIIAQFENIQLLDKIIIIDDIESYIIYDRSFLHNLEDIIESNNYPSIKIIITATNIDAKSIHKFSTTSKIIKLLIPDSNSIFLFLRKKYPEIPVKVLMQISEYCNGNISNAIQMVEFENSSLKEENIYKINEIGNALNSKTVYDNFPDIIKLYNEDIKREESRYIFEQDNWLHPLRFHENLINEMNQRKGLHIIKEKIYTDLMKYMCEWDYLMSHWKGTYSDIPIEYACGLPVILNKLSKKKQSNSTINEFTRLFNYLSLKKKSSVSLYNNQFPWIYIGNGHKYIYTNMEKEKEKELKKNVSSRKRTYLKKLSA